MPTYSYRGFLSQDNDHAEYPTWIRNVSLHINTVGTAESFQYSRNYFQNRPQDAITLTGGISSVRIGDTSVSGAYLNNLWMDVETITWKGGSATVLHVGVTDDRAITVQLGGTPLPTFNSQKDFTAWADTITSSGMTTSGKYGPGAWIELQHNPAAANDEHEHTEQFYKDLGFDKWGDPEDNPNGGGDYNYGGDNSDYPGLVRGTSGADVLYGGELDNIIYGYGGNDIIYGNAGNDTIYAGDGNTTVWGGTGHDVIHGGDGKQLLSGGDGNDMFYLKEDGSAANTTVWAGDGNDTVFAGNGQVEIWLGNGDSTIYGGAASGVLGGGHNNDFIDADGISKGDKFIWAGKGNDTVIGSAKADQIGGGEGSDILYGGAGNDTIWGAAGNDSIDGGEGDDLIYGGDGNDDITGWWGNDRIFLGAGDDYAYGGSGNDTINAGAGNDTVYGGMGADTFEFYRGQGNTLVGDFSGAEGDTLALSQWMWRGAFGELNAEQVLTMFGRFDATNYSFVLDFGAAETKISLLGYHTNADLVDHITII